MNQQERDPSAAVSAAPPARRAPTTRRLAVADAALAVLAHEGARGLTHRAVDRRAGLPEGSTSNVFRSRAALLEGALERHAQLDMPPGAEELELEPGSLQRPAVRDLILAGVANVLAPEGRELIVARYELLLESTRRPALHEAIARTRDRFLKLARTVLSGGGCSDVDRHAPQMLALLDGVLVDRLHGEASSLSDADIAVAVERLLADC